MGICAWNGTIHAKKIDGEKILSRNHDRNCNSTVATFKRSKGFCLPNCQSKQPTPAIFKTKDLEVLVSCCNLGTPAADDGKPVERISPANARSGYSGHTVPPILEHIVPLSKYNFRGSFSLGQLLVLS